MRPPVVERAKNGEEEQRLTATLAGAVVVLLLLIVSLYLGRELSYYARVDNCIASGARDCLDLPGQPGRVRHL